MPYIKHEARQYIDHQLDPLLELVPKFNEGELNYVITRVLDTHLNHHDRLNYRHINQIMGVLECVKQELYRRVAAPYEDTKCKETGDVYERAKADGTAVTPLPREEIKDVGRHIQRRDPESN